MLKTGCLDLKSTFNIFISTYSEYYCKRLHEKKGPEVIAISFHVAELMFYFEKLLKQFSVKFLINLFCIIFLLTKTTNQHAPQEKSLISIF